MNSTTGHLIKSSRDPKSMLRPFDKYANSCDKHFKYSVYTMKKDNDEAKVQTMAKKRVNDTIQGLENENNRQKKEFYK